MTDYSIVLNVEGGGKVEIQCKDKADYEAKSKFLETTLPDKDWKELRIKPDDILGEP